MKERIADLIARIDDLMAEDRSVISMISDRQSKAAFQSHHDTLAGVRNELSKILKESE